MQITMKTHKQINAEGEAHAVAELQKTMAAQLSEAERFELAVAGLAKITAAAESTAAASCDEAAELRAVALRRRLGKVECLYSRYTETVAKLADTAALDAARDGYENAVARASAKLETLLPGVHRDEAARLVTKYAPPKAERMALLAEQAVAGNLSAAKMQLARELWQLLEAAGTVASGADSGARGLIEKGRGA